MKRLKSILTILAISLGIMLPTFTIASQGVVQAACDTPKSCAEDGACATNPSGCPEDPVPQVNKIIATIINVLSFVVGVVAVIMIIIGGFRYITSGGDSGNVTSAKNTILYAIVGLVIVALAQIIVRFVLARV